MIPVKLNLLLELSFTIKVVFSNFKCDAQYIYGLELFNN